MGRLIWDSARRDFVEPAVFYATRRHPARSSLPRPMLIRDQLADVWNPVDGQHYDSRSNYLRAVKAAGCEVVGNDPAWQGERTPSFEPHGDVERDVADAIEKLST